MRPLLRLGLVLFVLAWILGPYWLRSTVPLWAVFLLALGLELQFVAGALRGEPPRRRERSPQAVDQERYGYGDGTDDLVLVRVDGEELWVPYAGESEEELAALVAEAQRAGDEDDDEDEDEEQGWRQPRWSRVPLRRLLAALGFLAVVAALLWVAESSTGWDALAGDARREASALFSAEASRIAGKPVTIRCDESGDYVGAVQHTDGVAVVGGALAFLAPERCLDLYRLAFRDEVRGSQTARALAVLAHEAWHLRGVRDEGETECYALQSAVALGERLGLAPAQARQLMRQQLAENELRRGGSTEYRVPPGCRDGGPLDLDRGSGAFP